MQKEFEHIEDTAQHLNKYIYARLERIKLEIAEKSSDLIAEYTAKAIVCAVFLLALIFGSDALAFGIGEYFGKTWLGFLIVGAAYLFIGFIIWKSREKWLRIPIMNAIIRKLFIHQSKGDEEV